MSGNFFYDFWMGYARNPRIGTYVCSASQGRREGGRERNGEVGCLLKR